MQARNYLLACFAVSLIRGETLLRRGICHATIWNYVNTAAALHRDCNLPSPYNAPTDYISIVLKAVNKFEKEPNQRSMIDNEMIHHIEHSRQNLAQDSLEAALIDWIYLGRFVGYRSIEWCQTKLQEIETIDHPNWEGR